MSGNSCACCNRRPGQYWLEGSPYCYKCAGQEEPVEIEPEIGESMAEPDWGHIEKMIREMAKIREELASAPEPAAPIELDDYIESLPPAPPEDYTGLRALTLGGIKVEFDPHVSSDRIYFVPPKVPTVLKGEVTFFNSEFFRKILDEHYQKHVGEIIRIAGAEDEDDIS